MVERKEKPTSRFLSKWARDTSVIHVKKTVLYKNETNVKVIQSVMGHADIQTTMDVYAEVTERKKRESMDNLSKNMSIFRKES